MNNKKENNTHCSMNATLPLMETVQLTEKDGYLTVARDFLQGVEALSKVQKIHQRSCSMVAGFALECALKAFLLHKLKVSERGHDLIDLWKKSYEEGLEIPEVPPTWVALLAKGHGRPYYFRYQQATEEEIDKKTGKRIEKKFTPHSGAHPQLIQMAAELKKLIEKVESICRC